MPLTENIDQALVGELADIGKMFAELQAAVGLDMRDELLALFLPTYEECVAGLEQAFAVADAAQVVAFAHKLKGAAAQLGSTRLSVLSKEIEQAGRSQALLGAIASFEELKMLGAKLVTHLQPA